MFLIYIPGGSGFIKIGTINYFLNKFEIEI